MTGRIDQLLFKKEKSLGERMILFPLTLLSFPYGGVVRARSLLYSLGLIKSRTLPCPVISVGNITVGGTGKTPHVMALAQGLMKRGIPVAILSRGYKGKRPSGPVVSDGSTLFLSPKESGDEPFLMASSLKGIPVLVGRDRFQNGRMALQRFTVRGLVLDDGFQHLPLHRDLNILLVDSLTGFGDAHLLPRGILREPLSQLRRSDLLILTKVWDREASLPLEQKLRKIHPSAPILHSHYEPLGLIGPRGEWEEIGSLRGKKVLALSGIADPGSFSSLLRRCGMVVVEELVFPDHHLYTSGEVTTVQEKAERVDWVVTTEKDLVKLKTFETGPLPLRALRIEVKVWEEELLYKKVMELF